jgi:hypothetical protein
MLRLIIWHQVLANAWLKVKFIGKSDLILPVISPPFKNCKIWIAWPIEHSILYEILQAQIFWMWSGCVVKKIVILARLNSRFFCGRAILNWAKGAEMYLWPNAPRAYLLRRNMEKSPGHGRNVTKAVTKLMSAVSQIRRPAVIPRQVGLVLFSMIITRPSLRFIVAQIWLSANAKVLLNFYNPRQATNYVAIPVFSLLAVTPQCREILWRFRRPGPVY